MHNNDDVPVGHHNIVQGDAQAQLEALKTRVTQYEAERVEWERRAQEMQERLQQLQAEGAERVQDAPQVPHVENGVDDLLGGGFVSPNVQNVGVARVDNYRVPKLPQFFRTNPALWFGQVEASFRNCRISVQKTMADTIIAALDQQTAELISDIIINPDPVSPYDKLKSRLLSLYGESEEARLRRLLRGQVRTDGKPSHVFALIKSHAGPTCSDAVLKSIFLEHMPDQMRALLAAADKPNLLELATYADLLAEAMNLTCNQAFAVSNADNIKVAASSRSTTPSRDSNADLAREIRELKEWIKKLSFSDRSRSKSRSDDRKDDRSRSKSRRRDPSGLCRLHKKYGDKAYRCTESDCSWKGSKSSEDAKN